MIFRRSSSLRTAFTAVGLMMFVCSWAFAQNNAFLAGTEEEQRQGLASILKAPQEAQVQALLTLLDLGEVELASKLWSVLGQADFEDPTSAAVASEIGTARLLRFARRETEADAPFAGARAFVDRCLNAAAAQARDPKRIAKLIADLNDPLAAIRRAARVDLSATGTAGAAACLEALAQAEEEQVRANLMFGLTSLHPEIKPLLLAALAGGHGHFRRDAAELAGYLDMREATPWLAAIVTGDEADPAVISAAVAALSKMNLPMPNARETRVLLMQEIEKIEAGVPEWPTDGSGTATWWIWRPDAGPDDSGFSTKDVSRKMIRLLAAERLSRMLLHCGVPEQHERQLATLYHIETWPILSAGLAAQSPLLESDSASEFSDTLAIAIKKNFMRTAITCASRLRDLGDISVLTSTNGRPSPLAAAVGHADRELRYAALEAIMKLSPQTTFSGASAVPKALWEFAAGSGAPQAVAASSIAVRGSNWAAQLRERGFEATPTTSGSLALAIATESPRLSLILIDSDIHRPALREVVFQLRSHSRTGRTPIAVLCSLHNLDPMRRLAAGDDWLIAVPRPHDSQAMDSIARRLKEIGSSQESLERRTEQAVQTLTWIAQLLEQGHPYDELHRHAAVLQETVYQPELVEPSLQALAVIGTAGSQQTLLDLVSQGSQPVELRRSAANAFASNVRRVGKQLTSAEIHRQYDRYNASETADQETQQVLGQVLDALEGKKAPTENPGVATPGLNP